MKRALTSFLLLFLILAPAQSKAMAYSSDPEKFIGQIIDEAKIILSSQDSQETKARKMTIILIYWDFIFMKVGYCRNPCMVQRKNQAAETQE